MTASIVSRRDPQAPAFNMGTTRIGLGTLEPRVLLAGDMALVDPLNAGQTGSAVTSAAETTPDMQATALPGTVAGTSPKLQSVPSFEQTGSAVLKLDLGGVLPGQDHDQLDVAGRAVLGGTLSLNFIDDFRPVAGQVFDVLKWQDRAGSFTSYQGLYAGNGVFLKPVYQADRLQLVTTPIAGLELDAALDLPGLRMSGRWAPSVAKNMAETLQRVLSEYEAKVSKIH